MITDLRALGPTGLHVPALCLGTGNWGSRPGGPSVADSLATLRRAFDGGIAFVDTSNNYGDGESETRIGMALRESTPPATLVLQTKADRDMLTGDFSGDRIRRSVDESLARLGLDRLPMVYLHDPENMDYAESLAPGGPVEALVALRDEGVIGHLGISGGPVAMLRDYLDTGIFEAVITHNRFTLVDRSAEPLLARAHELGLGMLNGAPYGGGLLADYPLTRTSYHYGPAKPATLAAAEAMGRYLAERGIPLAAAALQVSLRDPRITSTIVGATVPAQADAMLRLSEVPIGPEDWAVLDALTPDPSEWIRGGWGT